MYKSVNTGGWFHWEHLWSYPPHRPYPLSGPLTWRKIRLHRYSFVFQPHLQSIKTWSFLENFPVEELEHGRICTASGYFCRSHHAASGHIVRKSSSCSRGATMLTIESFHQCSNKPQSFSTPGLQFPGDSVVKNLPANAGDTWAEEAGGLPEVRLALGTPELVLVSEMRTGLWGLFPQALWFSKLFAVRKGSRKKQAKLKPLKGLWKPPESFGVRMIPWIILELGQRR